MGLHLKERHTAHLINKIVQGTENKRRCLWMFVTAVCFLLPLTLYEISEEAKLRCRKSSLK